MNARDGKGMPVSWSLPFAGSFILPVASFVRRSEKSDKPETAQQYTIIASFFFFNQCRQGSLAIATPHNSRALFRQKVNKFPNVGLIKSKEMTKFKPG